MRRPVLEALKTPLWIFDIEARAMAWANAAAAELWGAPNVEGLLARDFARDMSEATAARLDEYLPRLRSGEAILEQWTFYPQGHDPVAVECRCTATALDDERTAMLVEAQPPSVQGLGEADLRGLEAVRHTAAAIGLYDPDGGLLYHNAAAYRAFGAEEVHYSARFVDPALGQRHWSAALGGDSVRGEAELHTQAGPRWFDVSLVPTRDPVTSERAVLADHRDISSLVAARAARADAEDSNRAKGEFLAHMSHEIRTPMTAILGFTEELAAELGPDAGPARDMVGIVDASARRLRALLDDLLDLSKLEARKLDVEVVPARLPQVLARLQKLLEPTARTAGLELETTWPPELEAPLLIDPTRVEQILLNLTGNAVKFTAAGRVEVRADRAGDMIRVAVQDTGLGLTAAQAARIFRPFEQADLSTTRRFGGSGLGLAISRRLAEVMNGRLELDWTAPREGSRFVLWLPYQPADAASATVTADLEPRTLPPGTRVLVAEDNPVNAQLVRRVMQRLGAEVTLVENGLEAVELLVAPSPTHFDVVLMDVHMPVLDGLQATRRLRASGVRTPIVALTAAAYREDRERAAAAGFDAFCVKPIDRVALSDTIHTLLGAK